MITSVPSSRLSTLIVSSIAFLLLLLFFHTWSPQLWPASPEDGLPIWIDDDQHSGAPEPSQSTRAKQTVAILRKAREVAASPIKAPYKYKFDQLGRLTISAREWVRFLDESPSSENTHELHEAIESAIATLYPFLSKSPKHPDSRTPFQDLRDGIMPGSRGIVIPTGKTTMRYAAHLIRSLQEVLNTSLPIMVAYAGDQDLPPADRDKMQSRFKNVEFLNILTVVSDATLRLGDGGWAIKAFAALYAPYEQVILADADCVFVQPPENLYDDPLYTETGALLFHDRLIWQHAYQERHEWWRSQIHNPSAELNKSLVWTEDYAEEGDSGIVVLDKSRLDVLMGMMHIAWQNTKAVRDETTYTITYGDKESWWFGLELTGAGYAFEKHYGSMVGWPRPEEGKGDRVCSFYIGHVDTRDALFWYNGGLLVNKRVDSKAFGIPTHLMVDGTWHKGGNRKEDSCMDETQALGLPEETVSLLNRSVVLAKELDEELGFLESGQE